MTLPAQAQTVWLSNGKIVLGVAPQVGRVIHFGPSRRRNLIWLSPAPMPATGYVNYGGEKLWPALQALWPRILGEQNPWPPDPATDGPAWRVIEQSDRAITLQSPLAPTLGVRMRRRFELARDRPALTITNTITRTTSNIYPVHAWSVAQARLPERVLMDAAVPIPGRDRRWLGFDPTQELGKTVTTIDGQNALAWRYPTDRSAKIGTLGRWMAGVFPDMVWVLRTEFDPDGSYPDGSSLQTYADPTQRYAELELLSPSRHLQVGQRLVNTVRWELWPRRGRDAQALARAIASGDPASSAEQDESGGGE